MARCGSKRKSLYKGVYLSSDNPRKRPWYAQVKRKGKSHWAGRHETELDAAVAYDKKAKEIWGDLAVLNFPDNKPDENKEG